ncbi:hypothetical protein [Methylobacterium sp. 391_Methyba4]|uniref:hypothetical protein n=1 Tax=Methylobacterium sp. 391_Methyba4 TaxID=3038924 RepID=UPI00241F81A1|nr:hypothetical protein [Methylobacterium sp. 391_Methyba4]WFS06479.1 hypothetical protein P9K36_24310 [Methylobacterium sp. 391_Methyba4]
MQHEAGEARPHRRRPDTFAREASGSRADEARRQVCRAARVDHDRALPTAPQVESSGSESDDEAGAVRRLLPSRENRSAQVVERHAGPLFDATLAGRHLGDGPFRPGGAGCDEPSRHIVSPILAQGLRDAPGELRRYGRKPGLVLDDARAFLAAGVIVGQVDHGPRGPDQGIDPVLVDASVLVVHDATVRLPVEPELSFEQRPETCAGDGVVGDARVGAAVDVIDRARRPAARALGDQFADLAGQARAAEAARLSHGRAVLTLQEVTRQGVSEAGPTRRPRDHGEVRPSASGTKTARAAWIASMVGAQSCSAAAVLALASARSADATAA